MAADFNTGSSAGYLWAEDETRHEKRIRILSNLLVKHAYYDHDRRMENLNQLLND